MEAINFAVFDEESSIVLCKWLFDVCKYELQFPSHRRAQYEPFTRYIEAIFKQAQFQVVRAGRSGSCRAVFEYPKRDGLREVVVLQSMLELLGNMERDMLLEVQRKNEVMHSILDMLERKTMGASPQLLRQHGASASPQGQGPDPAQQKNYEFLHNLATRYCEVKEAELAARRADYEGDTSHFTLLASQREKLAREVADFAAQRAAAEEARQHLQAEATAAAAALAEVRERCAAREAAAAAPAAPPAEAAPSDRHTVQQLRRELAELGAAREELQHKFVSSEQVHQGRVKQARQKVTDWTDMLEKVRATHHQRRGQAQALATVMANTAARLQQHKNSGSSGLAEQFRKLNHLMYVRTSEKWESYMNDGSGGVATPGRPGASPSNLGNNSFGEGDPHLTIRPLAPSMFGHRDDDASSSGFFRDPNASVGGAGGSAAATPKRGTSQSPSASLSPTPQRQGSVSSAAMPADPATVGPNGEKLKRSRYDVVTHLERWLDALERERQQLQQIAGQQHVTGGGEDSANAHRRLELSRLKAVLLPPAA